MTYFRNCLNFELYLFIYFYFYFYFILQLKNLLQNVIDPHALSLQLAQLTRQRNYDNEVNSIPSRHSRNTLEWTYISQQMPVDTDLNANLTPTDLLDRDQDAARSSHHG